MTALKSTVRLAFPDFLTHTTMRLHQVSGVFTGTFSITPILTSRSSSSLTCCCKWSGMVPGLWTATSFAVLLTNSLRGGEEVTKGSFWFVQTLKLELAYCCPIQSLIRGTNSSSNGKGHSVGGAGGAVLVGQLQGLVPPSPSSQPDSGCHGPAPGPPRTAGGLAWGFTTPKGPGGPTDRTAPG